MKKLMYLPVLAFLVVILVACGKNNDVPVHPIGAPVVVDPSHPVPPQPQFPHQPPIQNQISVSDWCYQQGGHYYSSHDLCRIQENKQYGYNINMGAMAANVMVFRGDHVRVRASGSPSVIVGGRSYGSGTTFVSRTEGPLVLQGDGFSSFRLRSVQITRCYGPYGFGYTCP